jgi:hypothetical protein
VDNGIRDKAAADVTKHGIARHAHDLPRRIGGTGLLVTGLSE